MLGQGEVDVRIFSSCLCLRLAEISLQLWRHLKQGQTSAVEVSCELTEGHGLLHLRLEFDPDASPMRRVSSASSVDRTVLSSPSRFSLRGRRPTGLEDS